MARPTKLTSDLINALEKVLKQDNAILVYTDEDLVDELNELLDEKSKISLISFKAWKGGKLPKKTAEKDKIKRFLYLIKKALRTEHRNLLEKLQNEEVNTWQRYAWIIERKFSEWNLKKISETDLKSDGKPLTPPTINYIVPNDIKTNE